MVKVFKINSQKPDEEIIKRIAYIMKEQDELVIYPTDTVYGLGANPFSEKAVIKVYQVKQRKDKPLPILVSSIKIAESIAFLNDLARELIEKFWPGALTIIVPKKSIIPEIVTLGKPNIAIRMPNHKVALLLAKYLGGAIIGTSANITGHPSPKSAEEAIRELGDKVNYVIDSGPALHGVPSTIIDLTQRPPKIIREGAIKINTLRKFIKNLTT